MFLPFRISLLCVCVCFAAKVLLHQLEVISFCTKIPINPLYVCPLFILNLESNNMVTTQRYVYEKNTHDLEGNIGSASALRATEAA